MVLSDIPPIMLFINSIDMVYAYMVEQWTMNWAIIKILIIFLSMDTGSVNRRIRTVRGSIGGEGLCVTSNLYNKYISKNVFLHVK